MKLASRFMPQYKPNKARKLALLGFAALSLALIIFQPIYLAVVAGIALFIIIWAKFEQPRIENYFQKMCDDRRGLSICDFAREFDARSVDTWIIRATYEQLQAALPTKQKVPIKASDSLFETLKLDVDDLDLDLADEIAQRTGRNLANIESNPYYGKITTAENLVLFFNHQGSANAT